MFDQTRRPSRELLYKAESDTIASFELEVSRGQCLEVRQTQEKMHGQTGKGNV